MVDSFNKASINPATIYFKDNVHGVVRDDVTGKIIQISDLDDTKWIFDIYNKEN